MPSCIVNQCCNKSGRKGQSQAIMFHKFPNDIGKIISWLESSGQKFNDIHALSNKIMDSRTTSKYVICSGHFSAECYDYHYNGIKLKPDAIPSIFPTVSEGETIIEENLKKNRHRSTKRVFESPAQKLCLIEMVETENLSSQEDDLTKPGFRSFSTQTYSTLINSTLIWTGNSVQGIHTLTSTSTGDKHALHSAESQEFFSPLKKMTPIRRVLFQTTEPDLLEQTTLSPTIEEQTTAPQNMETSFDDNSSKIKLEEDSDYLPQLSSFDDSDLCGHSSLSNDSGPSEKRLKSEKCPGLVYSQDCHNNQQVHQAERLLDIKIEVLDKEEEEMYIKADQQNGSCKKNPPDRCSSPLYSQVLLDQNDSVKLDHQGEDLTNIKLEVKVEEEETHVTDDQQNKEEEEIPVDVDTVDDVTRSRRSCQDHNPGEIMQIVESGLSAKKKKPYIYFERLSLQSSIIEQLPSKSNLPDVDPALQEEAINPSDISATAEVVEPEKTVEVSVATTTSTEPEPANAPSCASRWSHKRKGQTTATVTGFQTRVLDYLSRLVNDDGEESFCRSLVPYVRRVPTQIRLRTRAALQIVVKAAIPPSDPVELFAVLEHWQQTGHTVVNKVIPPPVPSQPPPATVHSHIAYSRPHGLYRTVSGSELNPQFHVSSKNRPPFFHGRQPHHPLPPSHSAHTYTVLQPPTVYNPSLHTFPSSSANLRPPH
ncbi:uncharacterized protein [Phyllobates terribilis]|uniref:uncharacterized protein isoform X2 n=1 Tax=Phyllobates terribilis TaxID=111132 RepID=UPI003CCB3528